MGHIQRHHLRAAVCAVAPCDLLRPAGGIMTPLATGFYSTSSSPAPSPRLHDTLLPPKLLSGRSASRRRAPHEGANVIDLTSARPIS